MLIQIAVLGRVFLGEAPGVFGVVGIFLVSIGVFFTQATSPTGTTGTGFRRPARLP